MHVLTQIQTVATEDGTLTLKDLPVQKGQAVQIVLLAYELGANKIHAPEDPMVLRTEALIDRDPFEPIGVDDWEAMR
jgi:hypothetical protein